VLQCYCYVEWTVHTKIHFGSVLKCSLSAHWMQVKIFFVIFNLNCGLHVVSAGKPSEQMLKVFGRFGFLKTESKPIFSFPRTCSFCAGRIYALALFICCFSWKIFCRWWNCTTCCIRKRIRCLCQISTAHHVRWRWPSLLSGFISVRRHRMSDCSARYHMLWQHILSMNRMCLWYNIDIVL